MTTRIRAPSRGKVYSVKRMVGTDLEYPEIIFDQLKLHEEYGPITTSITGQGD
jgi:hypothetical protein